MNRIHLCSLTFILFCSFFSAVPVSAEETIFIDKEEKLSLGTRMSILEDKSGNLTIDDVRREEYGSKFIPGDKDTPYYGFTSSAYWVRFTLSSLNRIESQWFLVLGYPLMDSADFYAQDSSGNTTAVRNGYSRPFEDRLFQHRYFIYDISLPDARPRTFYLRFTCTDRMEIPLILYSLKGFQRYDHNTQYILGGFLGFIIFMFVYNLLLFFSIRDRTYIIYCFFLLSYASFQISQNGTAYEYFWPTSLYSFNHFIPLTLSMMFLGTILFTRTFLDLDIYFPRLVKISKGIEIYLVVTIFLPLFLPYSLTIWIMLVTSLICAFLVIAAAVVSLKRNRRNSILYLCGWTVFVSGGILYALKVADILPSGFIVNYAMQIGATLQFIILSSGLGIRINKMRMDKDKAEQEESLLQKRLSIIAENTDDLIFTLDENLNFTTMNNSVSRFLSGIEDNIIDNKKGLIHFSAILHNDENEVSFARQIIIEQIENAKSEMKPLNFKADFIPRPGFEPETMHVRLEFIKIQGRNEIVGRAWRSGEDPVLQYFLTETQEYSISNLLPTADEISHRLTRNLGKYLDAKVINLLKLGIREMVLNAIEHGNLNITYEEKTNAQMNDTYFELIEQRRKDFENRDKKVHILFSITPTQAVYHITDFGRGFDHRNLAKKTADTNNKMLSHGRGVMIAVNVFDKVVFNEIGNSVTLIKYYNNNNESPVL